MKKLTRSLIVAGLAVSSLGVYAATPTGTAPFQVMVPNLKSGFDFTLQGLLLEPTNSDLNYVTTVAHTGTFPNIATTSSTNSVTPGYDFGFGIGIGYIFPESGNDVRANWTHFDHDSDGSVFTTGNSTNPLTVYTALGDSFSELDSTETLNSNSNVSFQYDAVDLDVGQYMSIGTRLQTRLFAGLRYTNLKNDVTDTYTHLDSSLSGYSDTDVETFNSKFTGIGPRAGIDTSYHIADCFGFTAHFATALLVGRVESSTTDVETEVAAPSTFAATTTNSSTFTTSNQTRVVPAFDGKLGFDYTAGFNNDTSHLVIEAGYQVTQYIDAIDRLYNGYTTTSGVGFNGPYLSLNFKI